MAERLSSRHLDAPTIADLDAGVLDAARAAAASAHLATCRSCRQVQADLAELSDLLGAATAPTMPRDVAARIDAALTAAAGGPGKTPEVSSPVVELAPPRRRRWLAPLAAAAAAVVAISVAGEVMQPTGTDDSGSSTANRDTSAEGGGAGDDAPEAASGYGKRKALVLSTDSFKRDVARQVYGRTLAGTAKRDHVLAAADELAEQSCAPARIADGGQPLLAFLDGEPAFLYLSGPRSDRLAVAVSCESGRAVVVARTRLDLE